MINWVYDSLEVNLTTLVNYVDIRYLKPHSGWKLVSTAVGQKDDFVDESSVIHIAFQVKLMRKPAYFVGNLVIPAVIMTLMTLLVFCIPAV